MWQQVHPGRATGRRGQHVFEIFAMDADNKCKNENVENEASGEDDESTDEDSTESKTRQERHWPLGNHHMSRRSQFCSYTLKITTVDDVSSVVVWTFVAR